MLDPAALSERGEIDKVDDASKTEDGLLVQSVLRAFQVLEAFSSVSTPCSLNDLARLTGLHKSAVQRLCRTMVHLGYMSTNPNGGFILGSRILDRTSDFLRNHALVRRAVPVLSDLRNELGEGVNLSLHEDLQLVYAIRMQSKREHFHTHLIGRRVPIYCTSGGIAVMAALPDEKVKDILSRAHLEKLTPKTIVDPREIHAQVAAARENSYALALEQVLVGEISVGVAVLDGFGCPLGAVHVVGSLSDWSPTEFSRKVVPGAIAAARALSH